MEGSVMRSRLGKSEVKSEICRQVILVENREKDKSTLGSV
jgi:hypothetical protein